MAPGSSRRQNWQNRDQKVPPSVFFTSTGFGLLTHPLPHGTSDHMTVPVKARFRPEPTGFRSVNREIALSHFSEWALPAASLRRTF